jgi:hypothetical protein
MFVASDTCTALVCIVVIAGMRFLHSDQKPLQEESEPSVHNALYGCMYHKPFQ